VCLSLVLLGRKDGYLLRECDIGRVSLRRSLKVTTSSYLHSREALHRRGRKVYNNRLAASAEPEAICLPSHHLTPSRGDGASSSGGDRGVFSRSSRTLPEACPRITQASCSLSRQQLEVIEAQASQGTPTTSGSRPASYFACRRRLRCTSYCDGTPAASLCVSSSQAQSLGPFAPTSRFGFLSRR
jgi:hypothetical protein